MILFESCADKLKVGAGFLFGFAIAGFCVYAAFENNHFVIELLICALGGVLGWSIGLYVTPANARERKTTSDFGKLFLAVTAGFGFANYKSILAWISSSSGSDVETDLRRALLFLIMFFIGLLFTYAGRLLVVSENSEKRRLRDEALEKVRDALSKLEAKM